MQPPVGRSSTFRARIHNGGRALHPLLRFFFRFFCIPRFLWLAFVSFRSRSQIEPAGSYCNTVPTSQSAPELATKIDRSIHQMEYGIIEIKEIREGIRNSAP